MTATTRPSGRNGQPSSRPLRFSSMESLGFDNTSSMWTESPHVVQARSGYRTTSASAGRHAAQSDSIAELQPTDFGIRLDEGNFRVGLLATIFVVLVAAGVLGFWISREPARQAEASAAAVAVQAEGLRDALLDLVAFNTTLDEPSSSDSAGLFAVDSAARALFDASADLDRNDAESRSASAAASGAALDGIRLAGDTQAYQNAVIPLLVLPNLETDPSLIELDEAARNFGEWQLRFDEVRTALPEGALTDVTDQLDIISADLASYLTRYVDALREDSQSEADTVIAELSGRLADVNVQLAGAIDEIQVRITQRVEEAQLILEELLDT